MSANFLTPKNWDNVTDNGRNNLVFQNRNHEYGAYTIRRDYNHHLFVALFISSGIFLSAFIIPKLLLSNNTSEIVIPTIDPIVTIIDITPPPAIIEEVTPPAVIEKPKVEIATQDNTTPVVVDNKVDNTLSTNDKIINPGKTNTTGVIGDPVIDKPFIERIGKGKHELVYTEQPLNENTVNLAKGFEAVSLFTSDNASSKVIEHLHSLGVKFISLRSVGYDHVDLAKAKQFNIKVANVPAYSPYAIAEHSVALLMALNRKIILAQKLRKQNRAAKNNNK
jgi:hypothetical protein